MKRFTNRSPESEMGRLILTQRILEGDKKALELYMAIYPDIFTAMKKKLEIFRIFRTR